MFRLIANLPCALTLVTCAQLSLSGCMRGPKIFGQDGEAGIPKVSLKISDEGDGAISAEINSKSLVTQVMPYSDGSAVEFPPGSLAISTSVTFEPGSTIASSAVASSLGAASLAAASSSYVLSSASAVDASSPFTINLSISSTSLRLADSDPYERMIVVYKVTNHAEGKNYIGFIPRAGITVKDGKASFQTKFFGAYQLAYTDAVLTAAKETETTSDILTKRAEKQLTPITWKISYADFTRNADGGDIAWATAEATGFATLAKCVAIIDKEKSEPWHLVRETKNFIRVEFDGSDFPDGEGPEAIYFVRFECNDITGRIGVSEWSTLFDPNNDPRSEESNSGSSFALVSASPFNAVDANNKTTSLVLNWNEALDTSTFYANVAVVHQRIGFPVPLGPPSHTNNQTTTTVEPLTGRWPLYTPLEVHLMPGLSGTSGPINNPPVFGFKTAAGTETAMLPVSNVNSTVKANAKTFMNDAGQAVAVWNQTGTYIDVWASYFDGTNWGTPQLLSTSSLSAQGEPHACISGDGVATVVWVKESLYLYGVQFRSGAWQSEVNIGTGPAGTPQDSPAPVVTCNDTGAMIAWNQYNSGSSTIYARHWSSSGTLEASAQGFAPTIGAGMMTHLAITGNKSGQVAVLWTDDSSADLIDGYVNIFNGAAWSGPLQIVSDVVAADWGELAMDDVGNLALVWHTNDNTNDRIYVKRHLAAGGWQTDHLLDTGVTGELVWPSLSVSANGNVRIAWAKDTVLKSASMASTEIAATQYSVTTLASQPEYVYVAASDSGATGLIWDLDAYTVATAYQPSGSAWSTPSPDYTSLSGISFSDFPVRLDPTGNATYAWDHGDSSNNKIKYIYFKYDDSAWPGSPTDAATGGTDMYEGGPYLSVNSFGEILLSWLLLSSNDAVQSKFIK